MQSVYLSKGRELLKLLINNGFEGYFVGECVRNTIMNIDFSRSDIVTNARIDDLKRINNYIFNDSATYIDDNTIKVVYNDYDFYFKSFSALENQMNDNRTKLTKHYSSNLLDELATRDFTIDAIAMSYSGKVTDAYNGVDDIKAKRIRTITNPKIRFNNYPLEILEAIKLVGELKFQVSDKTYQAMVKKAKLLITQNKEEIFDYMDAILHAKYSKKAFAYLLSRGIYKNIPSLDKGLKAISHTNKDISIEELLLASFVLNGEIDRDYLTYIEDRETFEAIFNLAMSQKKGIYEPFVLFKNGEKVAIEANFINYLIGRDHIRAKAISKDYNELKIKSYNDLAYDVLEISKITNFDRENETIKEIIDNVVLNILSETLRNDHDEIERFVLKELTTKGIYFDIERKEEKVIVKRDDDEVIQSSINADYTPSYNLTDDELAISESMKEEESESDADLTNHRLRILEERLNEQDRLLQEKNERLQELENQKILETTQKLVSSGLDAIKHDTQLASMIKNVDDFELEYRNFIIEYLEKEKKNDEQL